MLALEKELFEVVHMGDLISLPKRRRSLLKLLFKFDRQSPRVGAFFKNEGLRTRTLLGNNKVLVLGLSF